MSGEAAPFAEKDTPARRYYSCAGWGDGRDGAACFEGWEASVWTGEPDKSRPCPACKQRVTAPGAEGTS